MNSQGTTGNPKGVVLKHSHLATATQSNLYGMIVPPEVVLISYLPLAHIYEASSEVIQPPLPLMCCL